MCCTGAAESAALSSPNSASRTARSSEKTRTLTSPCEDRASVELLPDSGRRAVVADAHDRVDVVRLGALPCFRSAGVRASAVTRPIIGARIRRSIDGDQTQGKEAQQGVAARPPHRPLRQAGAARRLPGPGRLQAEGDRRAAAPAEAGPVRGRSRRDAGRLEPVRAAQVRGARLGGRLEIGPLHGTIIALDVLEFEPVDGVEFIQGDFRELEVLHALESSQGRRPAGRCRAVGHGAQPVGHPGLGFGAHGGADRDRHRVRPGPPGAGRARSSARCFTAAATASSSSASRPNSHCQADQAQGFGTAQNRPKPFSWA